MLVSFDVIGLGTTSLLQKCSLLTTYLFMTGVRIKSLKIGFYKFIF